MVKLFFLIVSLIFPLASYGFNTQTPLTPINNLFDAMRAHDKNKLLSQFTDDAILERATKTNTVHISDLNKFAEFVGKSTDELDEKLLNIKTHMSGNLASVWAPFVFYLNGKLSHCGVNSFQLIKQNNKWKIRYLIDNTFSGDCNIFINEHKKAER